jgi:hypothetical protein
VSGGEGQWEQRAICSGWLKNEGDEVSGKTENWKKLKMTKEDRAGWRGERTDFRKKMIATGGLKQ